MVQANSYNGGNTFYDSNLQPAGTKSQYTINDPNNPGLSSINLYQTPGGQYQFDTGSAVYSYDPTTGNTTLNGAVISNDGSNRTADGGFTNTGQVLGTTTPTAPVAPPPPDYSNQISQLTNDISGLNYQLGLLPGQLSAGNTNLDNQQRAQTTNVNNQFGKAQRDYNTQRGNTVQDRGLAVNNTLTQNRNRLSAFQRLLGQFGSGNSSAALEAAPRASATQSSQDLGGIQRTYGRNLGSLDTAFGDTRENRDKVLGDITTARSQGGQNLQADILQSKADLLDKIRQDSVNRAVYRGDSQATALSKYAPQQQTIQDILSQIAGLSVNPVAPVQSNISFAQPNLERYNLTGNRGISFTPQNQNINPLLLGGLIDQKDKNQL